MAGPDVATVKWLKDPDTWEAVSAAVAKVTTHEYDLGGQLAPPRRGPDRVRGHRPAGRPGHDGGPVIAVGRDGSWTSVLAAFSIGVVATFAVP